MVTSYLKELDSNNSEHELQENCYKHDVSDRFDSHNDALHHMLKKGNRAHGDDISVRFPNVKKFNSREILHLANFFFMKATYLQNV